ncbi:MAG: hypothetical protein JO262_14515 [Solirubrobacterales bacterium]|nr:hypothetical protein [Solirubrobacterales bacterium]
MRGRRPRASACGALLIAVFAAGCGGRAYTKSDFIARANAICADALRQTRSIPPPGAAQATLGQDAALGAYLGSVLPVLENEASQLRALRRPPGNAREHATLERYFIALTQTVRDYKELAAAATHGDDQAVADAEAALGASQVYSLAASYGLRACGAPGTTAVSDPRSLRPLHLGV